jgi:hypothetical protein
VHQIERPVRRIGKQIARDELDRHPVLLGARPRHRNRLGKEIESRDLHPLLGEPHGEHARAAADVECASAPLTRRDGALQNLRR